MRLNNEGLKDRKSWENAGYSLPEYDRETVTKATRYMQIVAHYAIRLAVGASSFISSGIHSVPINITVLI